MNRRTPTRRDVARALRDTALLWRPPDKKLAPGREGNLGTGAEGLPKESGRNDTLKGTAAQVRCTGCNGWVIGGSTAGPAMHATCWSAAGQRVKRVSESEIARQHRAEIAAWVADYCAAEVVIADGLVTYRESQS